MTLFWGGTPGSRPCFLVRGPENDPPELMNRNVGKTTLVECFASLIDGLMDLEEGEDIPALKTRLLSDEGMNIRVVRIDNVKTMRMSWAALESFITSNVISGRRLYRGNGSRPNTVTVFVTMNGGSLSKDLATRVVTIRLGRPDPKGTWRSDVARFVEDNRWQIIAEILGELSDGPGSIKPRGRWAEWQAEVLGKVADYNLCQDEIERRCAAIDGDDEGAVDFETIIRERLEARAHRPDDEFIKIPVKDMGVWYSQVQKAHIAAKTATERLQLLPLKRLKYLRVEDGRFWLWAGERAKGERILLRPDLSASVPGVPRWGE